MYVSGLLARNFRSLEDIQVAFQPGLNVLVGKNNAGKSNIIEALDYVLGEKWPTYRAVEDRTFYRSGPNELPSRWFLIVAKLEGGPLSHEEISNLSSRNAKTFTLPHRPPWSQGERLPEWLERIEDQRATWRSYTELASDLDRASTIYLFLHAPKGRPPNERKYGLVYTREDSFCYVPTINNEIRNLLLTTAYVPAFRDPHNQLRVNEYSWYGKLIKHLYGQQNSEQGQRISEAQDALSQVLREIFSDATDTLRQQLARAVFHHEITFRPGAFTRDDNYKQITLFVNDGLDAPFYDKGSGIQSALILALFTHYCRSFHKGSSLLMVEEPEIYLHPQARRALEAQLGQFVAESEEGETGSHQVIIATHSPEFLRSVSLSQLCLVSKTIGQNATSVKQDANLTARADQIVETKNAEMFFADHVVLVEGGEEYLLTALADLYFGETRWLDVSNVSVARVNGKGQFHAYTEVLNRFEIDWSILTDLDFLKDGLGSFSSHLDSDAEQALGTIRMVWDNLGELPKGKKIKEKVFDKNTRDWKSLYNKVDEAIEAICSGQSLEAEHIDEIQVLWSSLQDRVHTANYELLRQQCGDEIDLVVDQLKSVRIFVLSHGELEDYFTEEAIALSGSKDLRAMKVAQEISKLSSFEEAEQWLACDEFIALLDYVGQRVLQTTDSLPEAD